MIEESYVSFDTARMLKDAGFDVPCECYYSWFDGKPIKGYCDGKVNHNRDKSEDADISRPTYALAARWLREVYNLHVTADPFGDFSFDADGEIVDKFTYWGYIILNAITGDMAEDNNERFDNYEEALEAGLQKAIKLIKK